MKLCEATPKGHACKDHSLKVKGDRPPQRLVDAVRTKSLDGYDPRMTGCENYWDLASAALS